MNAQEKKAIAKLLDQIETLRAWLDDTAYPRRSRAELEEAVNQVEIILQKKVKAKA